MGSTKKKVEGREPDWFIDITSRNAGLRGRAILDEDGRVALGDNLLDSRCRMVDPGVKVVAEGYLVELPVNGLCRRCYVCDERTVTNYLESANLEVWEISYDFEIIEEYGWLVELTDAQLAWVSERAIDASQKDGI